VVVAAGVNVSVEDCPARTGLGLKFAVVPEGRPPVTDSCTFCAEPAVTVVLTVDVPLPPCGALALVAVMPKSDGVAEQLGNLKVPTLVCQLKLP
jgi:hypothetical protein